MRASALLATLSLVITSVLAFASPQLGSRLLTRDENNISYPPMSFSGTVEGQPFSVTGDVRDAVAELHRRFPENPKFDPAVIEREIKSRAFESSLITSASSLLNTRDDGFNPVPITRSCKDLAGAAATIRNGCRANRPAVCGQYFSNGGWNVVVRADASICW